MIKEQDIIIKIDPEIKKNIKEIAKKMGFSVSGLIRAVLINIVNKNKNNELNSYSDL